MLTLLGAGPGNIKLLTQEAIDELKKAELVIAFDRIAESIKLLRADIHSIKSLNEISNLINDKTHTILVASGDPCFFGIHKYLNKKNISIDNIIPGISAMQYLATKIKKTWSGFAFYSGHGREINYDQIKTNKQSFIFTDSKNNPNVISKKLFKIGLKGKMIIGFDLSYPNEKIVECKIGDEIEIVSKLSVILVENHEY